MLHGKTPAQVFVKGNPAEGNSERMPTPPPILIPTWARAEEGTSTSCGKNPPPTLGVSLICSTVVPQATKEGLATPRSVMDDCSASCNFIGGQA